MKRDEHKLICLVPPTVPMWGVFFEEGEPDDILILPVVSLAIVNQSICGDPSSREVVPLVFDRLSGVDNFWYKDANLLGFILQDEVTKAAEIFSLEIKEKRAAKGKEREIF